VLILGLLQTAAVLGGNEAAVQLHSLAMLCSCVVHNGTCQGQTIDPILAKHRKHREPSIEGTEHYLEEHRPPLATGGWFNNKLSHAHGNSTTSGQLPETT
jgi:GH25 family lysozyme M1 (1,4-beta-N-acetylmuramidase)